MKKWEQKIGLNFKNARDIYPSDIWERYLKMSTFSNQFRVKQLLHCIGGLIKCLVLVRKILVFELCLTQ